MTDCVHFSRPQTEHAWHHQSQVEATHETALDEYKNVYCTTGMANNCKENTLIFKITAAPLRRGFNYSVVIRNGARNFAPPNELLHEISLSQTKFHCPWNKMPCEISHVCSNIRTICALKYGWTFAFFQISHNFSKFRWNSLSLPLHSTVTGYSCRAGRKGIPHNF